MKKIPFFYDKKSRHCEIHHFTMFPLISASDPLISDPLISESDPLTPALLRHPDLLGGHPDLLRGLAGVSAASASALAAAASREQRTGTWRRDQQEVIMVPERDSL